MALATEETGGRSSRYRALRASLLSASPRIPGANQAHGPIHNANSQKALRQGANKIVFGTIIEAPFNAIKVRGRLLWLLAFTLRHVYLPQRRRSNLRSLDETIRLLQYGSRSCPT